MMCLYDANPSLKSTFEQYTAFISDINTSNWLSAAKDLRATVWCDETGYEPCM